MIKTGLLYFHCKSNLDRRLLLFLARQVSRSLMKYNFLFVFIILHLYHWQSLAVFLCLFVYLFVCLFVGLFVYMCLYVCLLVC